MVVLPILASVGAAISWLFAFVSWVRAVRHRQPAISLAAMLFNGMLAFNAANFTEEGVVHQRRFLIGFACFFLFAVLAAALGALVS